MKNLFEVIADIEKQIRKKVIIYGAGGKKGDNRIFFIDADGEHKHLFVNNFIMEYPKIVEKCRARMQPAEFRLFFPVEDVKG